MRGISLALAAAVIGCSGGGNSAGVDAAPEPGADAEPLEPLTRVWLPQAIEDALFANPTTYFAGVPLQIGSEGDATAVVVTVDGTEHAASDVDGDGTWTAVLPIADLADGDYPLEIDAQGSTPQTAAALLRIGRQGVQLTSVAADGNAGTPRLHWIAGQLWMTWTDGRGGGARTAWKVQLDGAGRMLGDPEALVAGDVDTLYARTAVGTDTIGVLFQQPGGPYQNWFTVLGLDGSERVAPIALDPEGSYGSFGGDVAFTGDAYVLVWRSNDGGGNSDVHWLRVAEADGALAGPVVAAAHGNEDPHGGFDPITQIGVAAVGDLSLVAFDRYWYHPLLELSVPRCQVTTIDAGGTVIDAEMAAVGSGITWHHECRIAGLGGGALLAWGAGDLTSAEDNPPTDLRATRIEGSGTLPAGRGDGALVATAPQHRSEPAVAGGAGSDPVVAWLDQRSYQDLLTGRIELYAATLDEDLSASTPVVFGHARFIEGTSELRAAPAGSNAVLVWIDERNGSGIADPKPELWFETVWR